ncbi:MAG: response regulator [Proteobacteria bacterium]|nr:response regulator [Pseudomonadota bacterium]MBU1688573.1 response regulator [Pseudomonadota bacterium]
MNRISPPRQKVKGYITVTSMPDRGTTFHIYLPIIEPGEEKARVESIMERQPTTGTECILLVDDEGTILDLQRQILLGLGYSVTTCASSIDALKVFREQPSLFDLVITDMTMPHMTGVQLTEKLLEIRPDIPIIICTGYSDQLNEQKTRALGIRKYLMKPVSRDGLASAIRSCLDYR